MAAALPGGAAFVRLAAMTPLTIYTDPAFLGHDTGAGHPERADRLRAIERALAAPAFAALPRATAAAATRTQLERVHTAAAVDRVLAAVPGEGLAWIDSDTVLSPGSREAALRAAGAVCAAVDAVAAGTTRRAFCAVRPPGHHAEPDRAMGFCLFNNVAVGAAHALAAHGFERVAIVDFDVHHGNGTQAAFEREPRVLFASSHQSPLYPGTGAASETGVGNVVNLPLAPGTDGAGFRAAWDDGALDRIVAFHPALIFVSAGFDAHRLDPLARLELVEDDYAWITERLCAIADDSCAGRVVSALEGGYDLGALAASAAAHVAALAA